LLQGPRLQLVLCSPSGSAVPLTLGEHKANTPARRAGGPMPSAAASPPLGMCVGGGLQRPMGAYGRTRLLCGEQRALLPDGDPDWAEGLGLPGVPFGASPAEFTLL
jgi:hypothetical protein